MQVPSVLDCCDTVHPDPLGLVRRSTQRLHAFVEHGKPAELLAACGLDAEGIETAVRRRLETSRADD